MKNTKSTKRALFASLMSLLICFAMLVGSTFAWFTDTASTGVNTIVSGNLDVALYKGTVADGAISYSKEVTTATKLFSDSALWEPGYTEVAYLKVENKGSLALKYNLTVNVINEIAGKNVDGNDIYLSKVLKYDVVDITATQYFADRTAALTAVENGQSLTTETVSGNMESGDTRYMALIVYMPTDVDNEANHDGVSIPSIQLGVSVVATQYTSESDSFDNQYDLASPFPVAPTVINTKAKTVTKVAAGDTVADVTVEDDYSIVTATVPAANYDSSEDNTYTTTVTVDLTDSSSDTSVYDIDVSITDKNGNDVEITEPVIVKVKLAANLSNVVVTHNGNAMYKKTSLSSVVDDQDYYYNSTTGVLTLLSSYFSPFEVVYDTNYEATINGKGYLTLSNALSAVGADETVVLCKDAKATGYNILKPVSIDLGGNTLTLTRSSSYCMLVANAPIYSQYNGSLALKNGTLKTSAQLMACGNISLTNVDLISSANTGLYSGGGVVEIDESSSVTSNYYAVAAVHANNATNTITVNVRGELNGKVALCGNGTATFEDATIFNIYDTAKLTADYGIYQPQNGTLNIYGGAFNCVYSAVEIRAGNLNVKDGTFLATATEFVAEKNDSGTTIEGTAIAVSQHSTELPINIVIDGGTFTGLYSLYEDDFQNSPESSNVSIIVNGGTFNGEFNSVNNKAVINGGVFNN